MGNLANEICIKILTATVIVTVNVAVTVTVTDNVTVTVTVTDNEHKPSQIAPDVPSSRRPATVTVTVTVRVTVSVTVPLFQAMTAMVDRQHQGCCALSHAATTARNVSDCEPSFIM